LDPVLKPDQLDDVAEYVLTLSNETQPSEASERGQAIFQGQVGGCYYCHGADAKGLQSQGAANLTDKIWAIVMSRRKVRAGQKSGNQELRRQGRQQYPQSCRRGRIACLPTDIKLLAVYVHQLGGAQ
jgi:cytochrome c oxidase cbb3-type subunit 3